MLVPPLILATFSALIAALFAAKSDMPAWTILPIYSATGTGVFIAVIGVQQSLAKWRKRRRKRQISVTPAKLHLRS